MVRLLTGRWLHVGSGCSPVAFTGSDASQMSAAAAECGGQVLGGVDDLATWMSGAHRLDLLVEAFEDRELGEEHPPGGGAADDQHAIRRFYR